METSLDPGRWLGILVKFHGKMGFFFYIAVKRILLAMVFFLSNTWIDSAPAKNPKRFGQFWWEVNSLEVGDFDQIWER